jgi:hypothetical protein
MFVFLPKALTNYMCYKCKQTSCTKSKGLEECFSMLQFIRENEEFLGEVKVIIQEEIQKIKRI